MACEAEIVDDICSFERVDVVGDAWPASSAGAHIDGHVDCGWVGAYPWCSDAAATVRCVTAVRRDPASRGESAALHALRKGQSPSIRDCHEHFPCDRSAAHHLLLAGGVGVTRRNDRLELLRGRHGRLH
jgi:vanillate O-demethylase ferredoxin subunit